MKDYNYNCGRYLSKILRHTPEAIGLVLDENGWADVDELLMRINLASKIFNGHIFTIDDLREIVSENNKKRFAFNEDETKIRASQGHSIDIDLEFAPIKPPDILYHGTGQKSVDSIFKEGIKKMNRQHVHLSDNQFTAVNVGQRHGIPHVVYVNSCKMYEDGIKFFKSENGVWLTDYVDPKYITNR